MDIDKLSHIIEKSILIGFTSMSIAVLLSSALGIGVVLLGGIDIGGT